MLANVLLQSCSAPNEGVLKPSQLGRADADGLVELGFLEQEPGAAPANVVPRGRDRHRSRSNRIGFQLREDGTPATSKGQRGPRAQGAG
jgi:hypothetical protein